MEILPINDTRAIRVELEKERVLLVSDLHIGISAELAKKGIEIPSQVSKVLDRLFKIIDKEHPDRLIMLGDIKHNIPITSMDEWRNLPKFFSSLTEKIEVEIVPGNHDGDIQGLISKEVVLHETSGTTIGEGKVGLIHGHAWPDPKLLEAEEIIMGHNHPSVEFRDELGGIVSEPAWIRSKLKPENLPKKLQDNVKNTDIKITVIPAFSKLVGGGAINRKIPEKLLGPIFKSDAIELNAAEIYLLDGTFLGNLENLRRITKVE